MNLLGVLKKEIEKKNINDKLKIAQYIYVRLGQIFEYDPLWIFGTDQDRIKIKNKIIDIENVTDFNITCFSWSRMYNELLKNFNIVSKIVNLKNHDNVQVYINGNKYLADLTASFIDITRIKFNMNTYFNCQISEYPGTNEKKFENVDDSVYERKIKFDEKLEIIKERLNVVKLKLGEDNIEYISMVFSTISNILNRKNVGFVSGIAFINAMLKNFINDEYKPSVMHLWDNNNSYAEVYYLSDDKYFIYRKNQNGLFQFQSCDKECLNTLREVYIQKDIKPNLFSHTK